MKDFGNDFVSSALCRNGWTKLLWSRPPDPTCRVSFLELQRRESYTCARVEQIQCLTRLIHYPCIRERMRDGPPYENFGRSQVEST